jgi:hypothetical protein
VKESPTKLWHGACCKGCGWWKVEVDPIQGLNRCQRCGSGSFRLFRFHESEGQQISHLLLTDKLRRMPDQPKVLT